MTTRRYVWDYLWRWCPDCQVIWKFDPPAWCFNCGSLTQRFEDQPALPPDDLRHGTTTGYRAGCRLACCSEANALDIAARRASGRIERKPRRRVGSIH